LNTESNVSERYAEGAIEVQESLCCPVDYDAALLKILPKEIVDKDYGCGDPSRYVREGDTVLDLGSGGGKICYMAAQLVGEKGMVIGIDMTDEMLALARKFQKEMADKLGGDRVQFHKGYIQDLALDLAAREAYLASNDSLDEKAVTLWEEEQKQSSPLIKDASVDIVVSNCVLNLVDEKHRAQMIAEIFRVLKPGGRVAISDIVSDEVVPQHLKEDTRLWSGCISGAFQEQQFAQVFLDAGFNDVAYDKWDEEPWQIVEGIEFRSVTVTANKPVAGKKDEGHTVIYRGPFAELKNDQGLVFPRGTRVAVSFDEYSQLQDSSTKESFLFIAPATSAEIKTQDDPAGSIVSKGSKELSGNRVRTATENKGLSHLSGSAGDASGSTNSGCC
jgi:arsenite methyltransferase